MRPQFIQTMQEYRSDYETAKQLGAGMLSCNAMLVPELAPNIALLLKTYPRPIVTNNDSAEVSYAGGLAAHVPGVPKTSFQGAITMMETETGQISDFAELLISNGGTTNCILYDGRMNRWTKAHELMDCAFTFEPGDLDSEGRSSIVTVSGNINYMYFGANASLGTTSNSQYGGTQVAVNGSGGISSTLAKAQNILNVVKAGNSLIKAAGSIF
jgi:hypothetical protein